jgi:hypothetical protein
MQAYEKMRNAMLGYLYAKKVRALLKSVPGQFSSVEFAKPTMADSLWKGVLNADGTAKK